MEMEVKNLVETFEKGVAAIRSEVESTKKDAGELKAKTDKIGAEVADAAEKVQQIVASQKALEAAFNRMEMRGEKANEKPEIIAESKAAFEYFVRHGELPQDSKFKLVKDGSKVGVECKAMSTDQNHDGGYLVLPAMADFMVGRVFETSPLRQVARVMTISNKSIEVIIDDNEAGSGWVDEGGTISETDTPEIGKLQIVAHKLHAEPKVTTEMLEDPMVDVEAWLSSKVAEKFARDQNTAFVSGNGIGKPKGFLTFSNWASAGVYERGKIEQIISGSAAALTGDGLINLQAALKEEYQGNATFLMHRSTYGAVLALKGADNYFFSTTLLRDGRLGLQLLGKPVLFASDMPAVGAGNLAIAYGDFSRAYTIVDRVGVQTLRDPYTSKGFVKFYTTARCGGAVTSYDALKIQKVSA